MDWTFIFQQAISAGIGVNAIIFALAAIGLNMHFGYTGLLNFGQAGFLAVGASSVKFKDSICSDILIVCSSGGVSPG